MADVLPSEELVEEPSDYGALQTGTRLGRYEMLVPIARGGMARVWAARLHGQRGFQKLVAIKVILPHLAEESEFERMFLDEARIASGVHHPNVCEIYELGEEKKTLYLVMEWVSGDSFARVLRSAGKTEAIDPRVAARVVADACAGVHAAHELTDDDGRALGVVHRDLSPHNILLTNDGTAKVCDFGVAKALGQLHEATSAGQLKGKIAYMAPEQITGAVVDRRSDVFSLGCVLYEATTGQRPFRGDGDHQVMHAVLKGELALPTSLIRNYPLELERIVMRALAPTPLLRFPTAERMRFALEEYVARGQLVTQSNVAQVLRSRIGPLIERRKERIRQASSAGDGESAWSDPPGNMTPSNQAQGGHRSGVKASNPHHHQQPSQPPPAPSPHPGGRPLFSTIQMDRPEAVAALVRLAAASESGPPNAPPPGYGVQPGSSTIPQAAPPFQPQHQQQLGHTPVSHPGASYPGASHPPGAPHSAPPAQAFSMPPQQPSMSSGPPAPTSQPFSGMALLQPPMGMPHFTLPPKSSVARQSSSPFDAPAAPAYDLGVSGESPHAQQQQQQGGAGHYAVAVGIGILVAAIIGGGGFYVWRGRQKPVEIAAPSTTKTVAAGAPAPPSPSPAASTIAPASADITFRLTPADATLLVEGRELPPDARSIPRPQIGKTVNVVVRAKGHEDVTILVDFFTSSPMDLNLKAPDTAAAAPATTVAAAAPPGDAPAKEMPKEAPPAKDPTPREPSKKPPRPAKDPGVPANPY